jgi:hypothetical protein
MNPGDLLVDRLDTDTSSDNDDVPVQIPDDPGHPSSLQHADGYGFRPASGFSSPAPQDRNSPLPDVNGLGWPGVFSSILPSLPPHFTSFTPP